MRFILAILASALLSFSLATVLPGDYSDGQPLMASELNQIKNERTGTMLPINASFNYASAVNDLGSGTYKWKNAYLSGGMSGGIITSVNITVKVGYITENVTYGATTEGTEDIDLTAYPTRISFTQPYVDDSDITITTTDIKDTTFYYHWKNTGAGETKVTHLVFFYL